MSVRIEGIEFSPEDAETFARRARRSSAGSARAGLSARTALAIQIEHAVAAGGGDVTLNEEESREATGVLSEWQQASDMPESARTLYRLLAPGSE
jgi:hypothetical protein